MIHHGGGCGLSPRLRTPNCRSPSMTRLIRRSSPRTGGVPLVIELFRRLGAAQVVNEQVRINPRQRGLTPAPLVESAAKICSPCEPTLRWPPGGL